MKAIIVSFLIACFPAMVLAQNSLQFVGATTGAACQVVEYHDNYLYAGTGTTLKIFDVRPGALPPYEMVFEYRYRSRINELHARGDYLYVAANHDGISKWDISNPRSPQLVARYLPDGFDEAAHDISFRGDTLFVAYRTKVLLLADQGSSFSKLAEFGHTNGSGVVSGGDLKDSLYAYVVGLGGDEDGLYIYDVRTLERRLFFPQTFADPEDVVFGKHTNLVHVLGGTNSTTNPFDPRGYFYSLDISNLNHPTVAFEDTLPGIVGVAIASAMKAVNRNDTLYVATQAALKPGQILPDTQYVYVYDATDPENIHVVAYLPAGLWHFDVSLQSRRLHIASEWFGVKTLDISTLSQPRDLGNTPTGGWNISGDKYGDYLLVANEGYGFKKYDVSDIISPLLVCENHDGTFCNLVKFSTDGNFIYATYSTSTGFMVFDANSLQSVDSIPSSVGTQEMLVWGNRVYVVQKPVLGKQKLNVIDVSDPRNVNVDTTITMKINDMAIEDGKLYIANLNGIQAYDISDGRFRLIATHSLGALQAAKTVAVHRDTVYAYISGLGMNKLVRYLLKIENGQYVIAQDTAVSLEYGEPQRLAIDANGLYLAYTKYGLFAYDRRSLTQTGYYRTGLDYKGFEDRFGVQDLYCRDGYIFLVEYFAQTTILKNRKNITRVDRHRNAIPESSTIRLYPNPTNHRVVVEYDLQHDAKITVEIYNVLRQKVRSLIHARRSAGSYSVVWDGRDDLGENVGSGVYFFILKLDNKFAQTQKLLLLK